MSNEFEFAPTLSIGSHRLMLDDIAHSRSSIGNTVIVARFRVIYSSSEPEDSTRSWVWVFKQEQSARSFRAARGLRDFSRQIATCFFEPGAMVHEDGMANRFESLLTGSARGVAIGAVVTKLTTGLISEGSGARPAREIEWRAIPGQTDDLLARRCCVLEPSLILRGHPHPGMLDAAMVEAERLALLEPDERASAEHMAIAHHCQLLLREGHR